MPDYRQKRLNDLFRSSMTVGSTIEGFCECIILLRAIFPKYNEPLLKCVDLSVVNRQADCFVFCRWKFSEKSKPFDNVMIFLSIIVDVTI